MSRQIYILISLSAAFWTLTLNLSSKGLKYYNLNPFYSQIYNTTIFKDNTKEYIPKGQEKSILYVEL